MAALNAAEASLTARQKAEYDIAKEKAKRAGNYGLGSGWQANRLSYLNKFLPDYKEGKLNEEQRNLFENLAGTMLTTERYANEKGDIVTRVSGLPEPIKKAIEKVTGRKIGSDSTGATEGVQAPGAVPTAGEMISQPNYPTMVSLAGLSTGPINVTAGALERFGAGLLTGLKEGVTQAQAFTELASNRMVRGFAVNPKFAVSEIDQIKKELDLLPGLLKSEGAYLNRALGVDMLLERLEAQAAEAMKNKDLDVSVRNEAAQAAQHAKDSRDLLGIKYLPLMMTNEDTNRIYPQIPVGSLFRIYNKNIGTIVIRRKPKESR
jgi:hypothetical protein